METTHLTQAPHHPDHLPAGIWSPAGNPDAERDWDEWCQAHPWLVEVQINGRWVAHEVTVDDTFRPVPMCFATEAEALDAIAEIARDFSPEELTAVRVREDGTEQTTVLIVAVVHAITDMVG